ncbi:helix-turn-helix transcriptional regulator [Joostella atrarenae]|uniref:Helix-turn-helix transcriptional regulator n=1 Tax=Joostella atrarenae TaxID=679257 RepID=A0ABS9J287_9FLAO|nr:helix-turn-helix transcriptional regulator [Joostella atrarenae]MCF8714465.1 helix-turn-helix transcriptional regulator [Joostella atrarenae]
MVNKEEFIKRLEKVLEFYDLSASSFADKIGVQRSSISHILSGRNNPSLDFVMKILQNFPDVELYWLLNGKGNFPPNEDQHTPTLPKENIIPAEKTNVDSNETIKTEIPPAINNTFPISEKNEIARIVVFYKNGTFEEYKNKQ